MTNDGGSQHEFNGRLDPPAAGWSCKGPGVSKGGTDPLGFQIDVKILAA